LIRVLLLLQMHCHISLKSTVFLVLGISRVQLLHLAFFEFTTESSNIQQIRDIQRSPRSTYQNRYCSIIITILSSYRYVIHFQSPRSMKHNAFLQVTYDSTMITLADIFVKSVSQPYSIERTSSRRLSKSSTRYILPIAASTFPAFVFANAKTPSRILW
jgi:hypothetical protein